MRFPDAADMIFDSWRAGDKTPHILLGPPGIGKSAIAGLLASRMTDFVQTKHPSAPPAVCRVLDSTTKLPEDMAGLPVVDRESGLLPVTRYAPQSWLSELCEPDAYGVLMFDDGTQALQSVQLAMRQILLQREVHDARLAERICVLVTGNRPEDKAGATRLPSHFINACSLHEIEPDFDGWASWYGAQSGRDPVVASFLRFRPSHFHRTPGDADRMGRFATPRTWDKLGRAWLVHGSRPERRLEVATGMVGEGAAVEFVAFVNTRAQLVDPEAVLRDPETALPSPAAQLDTPDKAYAMVTGIAEVAARWATGTDKVLQRQHGLSFLRAIGHATQGNRQYLAVGLDTFRTNGGMMKDLMQAATKNGTDPLVREVVNYLAKVTK